MFEQPFRNSISCFYAATLNIGVLARAWASLTVVKALDWVFMGIGVARSEGGKQALPTNFRFV